MEHHVYFWLTEEKNNHEELAQFEQGIRDLLKSPNIASSHWGKPAQTAERPVTDHTWTYGISLKFDSLADHDRYQEDDPVHEAFVTNYKSWFARVQVMDLA